MRPRAVWPWLVLAVASAQAPAPARLDDYDVVWRTPGANAAASMPIGNGEVGCNVWTEGDGRLCLYVARTDAFSEASRLLKLGKVTIRVRAPRAGEFFEQRLRVRDGRIDVIWGENERRVALTLLVDSETDVIHVLGDAADAIEVVGESWRVRDRRLEGEELKSSWTMQESPPDIVVTEAADLALATPAGRRGFCHRNPTSVVAMTLARQWLAGPGAPAFADTMLHRTFGLVFDGVDVVADAAVPQRVHGTTAGGRFALRIAALCRQPATVAEFGTAADAVLAASPTATARQRTAAWWQAFWARSWVLVAGDRIAGVPTNGHPLRLGVDSGGGNRFVGSIRDLRVQDGDVAVHEVAAAALPAAVEALRDRAFTGRLHIAATVTQDAAHPIGRIVDKVTAGGADGFLFDTHPGHALRLIVGDRQLLAERALTPGKAHRVEAMFDPVRGTMELRCDGKVVASRHADDEVTPPSRITQALVLQRWIQAGGGRGAFPIKFNGSIFTVEPVHTGGPEFDADWRRWGDCFWWQNTRLPYYPMLAQGDFEMLTPLFRLYRDTMPIAQERVRAWYGGKVQGAYWPETMTPFGTHGNRDYGWQRDGVPVHRVLCPWWEYARNQGLELLALLLDRNDYLPDPAFVREQVLPVATPVLAWFASAYPRDDRGRLAIAPTQSLETYWHEVRDDMATVAGLHAVLARLLALPAEQLGDHAATWRELQQALPPIPVHERDGVRMLAPAGAFAPQRSNCESPELYAVFPFRLFGLDRPEIELARAAYDKRHDRFTNGWPQDGQVAALLGMREEAKANLLAKVRNHNRGHRFPAMWGPNFDWCPDQCHGSNVLDVTHRMLLQCEGRVLRVLPCWPPEWDVAFRLHAPGATVVEVEWRNGKLERLEVTPAERQPDVVVGPG